MKVAGRGNGAPRADGPSPGLGVCSGQGSGQVQPGTQEALPRSPGASLFHSPCLCCGDGFPTAGKSKGTDAEVEGIGNSDAGS